MVRKTTLLSCKLQLNIFRLIRKTPFVKLYFQLRKWGKIKNITEQEARNRAEELRKKPCGHAYWEENHSETYRCDLSVIVPFYKSEQYAEKCIESILNQKTEYTFELILVDDGSPDGCGAILDSYANRENVRVIHKENGGVAQARNVGLKAAIGGGAYIMFVDSDDYLPEGSVQTLMQEAINGGYDVVEGGYEMFDSLGNRFLHLHKRGECSQGVGLTGFPWGKVMKHSLFNNVCFPEGFWAEDAVIFSLIYDQTKRDLAIEDVVYCYNKNPNGLTGSTHTSTKTIDDIYIMEEFFDVYQKLGIPVNDITRKKFISHFGFTTYGANIHLGLENSIYLFILTAYVAEKYGFLPMCEIQKLSFWEKQVVLALQNRQYERYREAIAMM